ncbi:Clu domain-containing protein [Balamuthia mandrillaris]
MNEDQQQAAVGLLPPPGKQLNEKKKGSSFRQRLNQQQKLVTQNRTLSEVKDTFVYSVSASSSSLSSSEEAPGFFSSASSAPGEEDGIHDWNGKFLALLERPNSLEQLRQLYRHAQDFVHTAEALGRIIINERHLPNEKKTIQPFISGVAGGEKFLSNGIWFKYAVDLLRTDLDEPKWMYGQDSPDDEKAMKSGGHELKGSVAFMEAGVNQLSIPLMVLIDYLGFRLVAIAQLPITADTIVYGTGDGGKRIHNDDAKMAIAMQTVANRLNLEPHKVGMYEIAVCADIEGHMGKDGKRYVIDYGRVFPPEGLPEQDSEEEYDKRSIFYKLLRPELVRWNPVALCSDGLSGFVRYDMSAAKYEQHIQEATKRLTTNIIPSFARKIYSKSYAKHFITLVQDNLSELLNKKSKMRDESHLTLRNILTETIDQNSLKALTVEMHKQGINVRHIGRIRHCFLSFLSSSASSCASPSTSPTCGLRSPLEEAASYPPSLFCQIMKSYYESRLERGMSSAMNTLLLVEMVVRVVKCIFRRLLRQPSRGSIRFEVLKLLNLLFCGESASEGMQFWENDIKNGILQKFGREALFEEERTYRGYLFNTIFEYKNIPLLLLQRLCEMTGIRLSSQAWVSVSAAPSRFQFLEPDLKEVGARVKYQTVVDVAEGKALFKQAAQHSSKSFFLSIDQAASSSSSATSIAFPTSFSEEQKWRELHLLSSIRLLDCAKLRFESAMSSNTQSFQVLYYHGRVLLELEKEDFGNNKHQRQLSAAVNSLEEAIKLFPWYQAKGFNLPVGSLARAKFHLANALSLWGGCKIIHDYYVSNGKYEKQENAFAENEDNNVDHFSKLHSSKFTPQHFFRAATKLYEEAILQSPKLLLKLEQEAQCWFNRVALMKEEIAQTRVRKPPRKGIGMLEIAFHLLDFILQFLKSSPSSASSSSASFSTLSYLRRSRREIVQERRHNKGSSSSSVAEEAEEERQWRLRMEGYQVPTGRENANHASYASSFPVDWTCPVCTFINVAGIQRCEMCETRFVPLLTEVKVDDEEEEEEEEDEEAEPKADGTVSAVINVELARCDHCITNDKEDAEQQEQEQEEEEQEDEENDFTIVQFDDIENGTYSLYSSLRALQKPRKDSSLSAAYSVPYSTSFSSFTPASSSCTSFTLSPIPSEEKPQKEEEKAEAEAQLCHQKLQQALNTIQEDRLQCMLSELKSNFFILWTAGESNNYRVPGMPPPYGGDGGMCNPPFAPSKRFVVCRCRHSNIISKPTESSHHNNGSPPLLCHMCPQMLFCLAIIPC